VNVAISRKAEIYILESLKNINVCLSTDIVATGVAQFVRTSMLRRMHERNTIKLHVQVFLKIKTWMFKTRRRHYN